MNLKFAVATSPLCKLTRFKVLSQLWSPPFHTTVVLAPLNNPSLTVPKNISTGNVPGIPSGNCRICTFSCGNPVELIFTQYFFPSLTALARTLISSPFVNIFGVVHGAHDCVFALKQLTYGSCRYAPWPPPN